MFLSLIMIYSYTCHYILFSDEEEEDPQALVYFPISVDIEDTEMENGEDNLFDDNITPSVVHKVSNKDKAKPEDAPKPLHPKNRNVLTVEM